MGSIKSIPTKWSEISVGDFIALTEIQKNNYETPLDMELDTIALLTNRTLEEVQLMNIIELKKEMANLHFMDTLPAEKLKPCFYMKGKMYDLNLDITKLNGGQVIDLQHFINKGGDNPITQAHNIIACLISRRKWLLIKGKYQSTLHAEIAELVHQNLSMDIAYPYLLFFSKVGANFFPIINDYLELEINRLKKKLMKVIKKEKAIINGIGIKS